MLLENYLGRNLFSGREEEEKKIMAAASTVKQNYGVQQFDGKNYNNWRFRVKSLIDEDGLKECLDIEPDIEDWKSRAKKRMTKNAAQ